MKAGTLVLWASQDVRSKVRGACVCTVFFWACCLMAAVAEPAGFELEAISDPELEKNLLAAALERVKRQVAPGQFQIFDLACLEG